MPINPAASAPAFNTITVTAPTGTTEQGPGRAPCRSPGRPTPAVATRPVQHLGGQPRRTAGTWARSCAADGTASYADSVDLNVPVGTGYRVFVYYRATQRRPLGHLRLRPGHGRRDAPAFNAITVTAPTGTTSRPRASALPVTWTTNASVRQRPVQHLGGQPRRTAGTWARSSPPTAAAELRRQRRPRTCPSAPATASSSTTAPRSGDPWGIYGYAPGTVDVTAAAFSAITVTAPTGTTSKAQGERPAGHLDDQRQRRQRPVQHLGGEPRRTAGTWARSCAANGTASYADSVDLERARRHRLPRLRLLPRHAAATPGASTATPRGRST